MDAIDNESQRHALRGPAGGFYRWELWALAILVIAGVWLGTLGHLERARNDNVVLSSASATFQALQLFVLEAPILDGDVPITLEVARWIAAAVAFYALIRLFLFAMQRNLRDISLVWRRGHIVICGLPRGRQRETPSPNTPSCRMFALQLEGGPRRGPRPCETEDVD